ncbi:MAG: hypothetical protein U0X87_14300 [Anaerolineales bacterium]
MIGDQFQVRRKKRVFLQQVEQIHRAGAGRTNPFTNQIFSNGNARRPSRADSRLSFIASRAGLLCFL